MPRLLALLVTLWSVAAPAQPADPCIEGRGETAVQDVPCPAPAPRDGVFVPFPGTPADAMGDWISDRPIERLLWTRTTDVASAARVTPVRDDPRAAQYAENRRRCQAALRIARLCGKHAGKFACDEKGFTPVAPDAASPPAVLTNEQRYRMDRCAEQAARSGP